MVIYIYWGRTSRKKMGGTRSFFNQYFLGAEDGISLNECFVSDTLMNISDLLRGHLASL